MFRILQNADVRGKRVIVRADFNVPFEASGPPSGEARPWGGKTIADDFRIRAVLPTVRSLAERGARVILMSHLGRPVGDEEKPLSLKPIAKRLAQFLQKPVAMLKDCVGDAVEDDVLHLADGEVVLLENLRFYDGEKRNSDDFAKKLARLGDIYVNDAFGVSHRAHASVAAVTKHLPSFAGPLLEKEVRALTDVLKNPKRPLVLIIGGAKIETKLPVIENFLNRAERILVGGALINTILAAHGIAVGASRVETDMLALAKRLSLRGKKLVLPADAVVSPNPHGKKGIAFRDVRDVRKGEMILDIGPKTVDAFREIIRTAATVVWNGPMGLFEIPAFAHGTEAIARAIAESSARSVVGGGDTGIVISRLKLEDRFDHISTGGGAMLEFLAGKKLPGLEALGYYNEKS